RVNMSAVEDENGIGISSDFMSGSIRFPYGNTPPNASIVDSDRCQRSASRLHENLIVEDLNGENPVARSACRHVGAPRHLQIQAIERVGRRRPRTRLELSPLLRPEWKCSEQKR